MTREKRALAILLTGASLCAGYAALVAVHPPQPQLAESNLTANRLRMERFFFEPPARTVLVGSSITGRILPAYFADLGMGRVANLGLDGATPLFGLELCTRREPIPSVILVEANQIDVYLPQNEDQLRDLMSHPAWKLASLGPIFRAESRPSTILYAKLKSAADRRAGNQLSGNLDKPFTPREPRPTWLDTHHRLANFILELKSRGAFVAIFRVPSGPAMAAKHPPDFVDAFCLEVDAPQFDVQSDFVRAGLIPSYTDGMHMNPSSARAAAQFLAEHLAQTRPASR